MKQKKLTKEERLQNIEEALERMACSLAGISGVLDSFYQELLREKEAELREATPKAPAGPFFHEEK